MVSHNGAISSKLLLECWDEYWVFWDLPWRNTNKHLPTQMTDQGNDCTRVWPSDPVSLLEFLMGTWEGLFTGEWVPREQLHHWRANPTREGDSTKSTSLGFLGSSPSVSLPWQLLFLIQCGRRVVLSMGQSVCVWMGWTHHKQFNSPKRRR